MAGLLAGTDKRFEEGCSMKVEQPFFVGLSVSCFSVLYCFIIAMINIGYC